MTAPFIRRESSPFLKRVLIPFWILRVIILLAGLGLYALLLSALIVYDDDIRKYETEYNTSLALATAQAVTGVVIGILAICLILELACIIKRIRRTLSPAFFLGVNIVQFTVILVGFVLSMFGARSGGSVGIAVAILIIFLGFLIYASVVYHKYRKGELRPDAERQVEMKPQQRY